MQLIGTSCLVIVCLIQILVPLCKCTTWAIQCTGNECCDIDVPKSNLTTTLCCVKDGCEGRNDNQESTLQNYGRKQQMVNRLKEGVQKLGGY
ncbi:unnamed protein product [Schistosoma rodhaini]|uniref:Uncharacterized protein n=1 Tax=Schistosoma rodhaini TaxID=6188 RepID=A0AA85FPA6_9TREM|nr:unnamed protein product [Schistosoma rodhaini]